MSVSPARVPEPSLLGTDGALVSVSIDVEPPDLEGLLEALAQVEFPINPQIYHEAEVVYTYPGGREEVVPVTLVEFPAYAGRLGEVRQALTAYGFDTRRVHIMSMLDAIQPNGAARPGARNGTVVRLRKPVQ